MIIVKLTNGNVILKDNSGNVIKRLVSDSFIQWTSDTTVDVYANSDKITTLVTTEITGTQIEPAAVVPFSGNAYDLLDLLADSFFFRVTGGGGSQNLTQVLTVGNSAGNLDIVDVDKLDFNTGTTDTASEGQLVWNNTDGTLNLGLKGGNVTLQVGLENVVIIVNKTNSNLLKSEYKVVRIRTQSEGGAAGQRLAVKLAQADTNANHSGILGLVIENINNNQEGFITTFGYIRNINTTGSLQGETWSDGDVIWLSDTVAGGLTNIEPTTHPVQIGWVTYAHANNGKIFVKVQEGLDELGELHDVNFANIPTNNEILKYNGSTLKWENTIPNIQLLAQASPNTTHTGNTNNTLIYSKLIEANIVGTGDGLQIATKFTKPSGSAANPTVRLYINTSASLSGATLLATYATTNLNGRFFLVERTANVDGATTNFIAATSGALTDSASLSTVASSDVSIDWTVNQYFIVAIQLGNSGDSTTLRMVNVILNKAI
jgi:hypothetical protein